MSIERLDASDFLLEISVAGGKNLIPGEIREGRLLAGMNNINASPDFFPLLYNATC